MAHNHTHHPQARNLKIAFFLNLAFTVIEIAGGFFVNSVAILSDALHDLGDSFSLGLSWFLQNRSVKAATSRFTFGFRRLSLLGAFINSLVLIVGSIFVIVEAVPRFFEPEHSNAPGMVVFALLGIAVNGYAAWKLSGGKSLNERVVSWHLLEDVLGWVAVLIVAVVLLFKNVPFLDPAVSLLITAYVLYNVVKRLKETVLIFLQVVPANVDPDKLRQEILGLNKVDSLHHLHIWSLEGEHHVFTVHVRLREINSLQEHEHTKNAIRAILKPHSFSHIAIETELDAQSCSLLPLHNADPE